eukprot:COSAG01_NODE_53175_length_341_cov_0.636364_1_plen_62_part_01
MQTIVLSVCNEFTCCSVLARPFARFSLAVSCADSASTSLVVVPQGLLLPMSDPLPFSAARTC